MKNINKLAKYGKVRGIGLIMNTRNYRVKHISKTIVPTKNGKKFTVSGEGNSLYVPFFDMLEVRLVQ